MHAIEKIDIALGTVQRNASEPVSWHGLETSVENLTIGNCGLSQLETKRGKVSVMFDDEAYPSSLLVPAIAHPLEAGKMHFLAAPFEPETYELFDYREFCAFVAECFKAAGLDDSVSFTTTLFEGKRMTIARRLPEAIFKDGYGHEVVTYINFLNSLDKSWPLFANVSECRTVCNNTATANLATGGASVKHKPEALRKWTDNFPQVLAEAILTHQGNANDYLQMFGRAVSFGQAQAFLMALLSGKVLSTTSYNKANAILAGFNRPNVGTYGKNGADLYNAVTHYFTHNGTQEANAQGGTADLYKREAKDGILSDKFGETVESGEKLLADYLQKK
jgi:hypothetical protein